MSATDLYLESPPSQEDLQAYEERQAIAEAEEAKAPPRMIEGQEVAWAPQEGSQTAFMSCPIFECLYHGTRGPGKTDALIMAFAQHVGRGHGAAWRGVIFRRTYPELGDVVAKTLKRFTRIFPEATFNRSKMIWEWPSGEALLLRHMMRVEDYNAYHGHEYPFIGWEELTNWKDDECFRKMISCCRSSTKGVPRMIRATTNPDADSWVKSFLAPWVDEEHAEYPFAPGEVRYFTQQNGEIVWVDADWRDTDGLAGKSVTFIPASVYDNKILLASNPGYLANLRALLPVERARLLHGDWTVRAEAGKVFNRSWFEVVPEAPRGGVECRFWDLASTERELKGDDPSYTAGGEVAEGGGDVLCDGLCGGAVGCGECG